MRILIAEDDADTADFVARGLRELGHDARIALDGDEAVRLARDEAHDVLVLDRMLPVRDGVEVLRALRAQGHRAPVLMLTALGRIGDRVEGLEAGADDYLVKPFAFAELAARVQALGRRAPIADAQRTELVWRSLRVDLLRREVTWDGVRVLLQPREFTLLEELMRGEGKILTRRMLLERVWEFHFDPQTNIVESHLSRLRSKLAESGACDMIETVRGAGYRVRTA